MSTAEETTTDTFIDCTDEEENASGNYGNNCTKGKQSVEMRTKINQRERRRMHDLNIAMDALREVIPYANGPTVRKLSKLSTLSMARNFIQILKKSVEELRQMLDEANRTRGIYNQYHRMTSHDHPGAWTFPSHDYRIYTPYHSCSPSATHMACGNSYGGSCLCYNMLSASESRTATSLQQRR